VNGRPAGYAQDSKLPSTFEVTDLVHNGTNSVALQVFRFADSSYLEDQDYWHLSGIYRNVTLFSKPLLYLADWKIEALPDLHTSSGSLTADVSVNRENGFADCRVRVAVYGADGRPSAEGEAPVRSAAAYRTDREPTANTARIRLTLPEVTPWTPETPELYTVHITLLDAEGHAADRETCRVGFKRVAVENGILKLNGQRLVIKGVNRHDFAAQTGRAVTREHMIAEIMQMKKLHINAVRTCHYPDSDDWYDLCDTYGLLVLCECNVETHGIMGQLAHDPNWSGAFLERAVRTAQTFKNHACIYGWSLGNESGTGANMAAMYGFF
jgi:beta-galactosidase